MTDLETFIELKRFLLESLKLGNVDRLFVEGALNQLETSLNVLNIFRGALTIEHLPSYTPIETKYNEDGSTELNCKAYYSVVRNGLEEELRKELTNWVIENIDKETVRKWLEEK